MNLSQRLSRLVLVSALVLIFQGCGRLGGDAVRTFLLGSPNATSPIGTPVIIYSTGVADPSFGTAGFSTFKTAGNDQAISQIKLQSDGKVVGVGYIQIGANYDSLVIRTNADGSLDTSFNGTGTRVLALSAAADQASSVTVQSDGKTVFAGFASNGGNGDDFAVTRLNADGSTDAAFAGGTVLTHFGFGNDHANALAIQSDGKLLAAGIARVAGAVDNFGVIRLSTSGVLDPVFGTGGKQTIATTTAAAAMAIQQDGKIVLTGQEGNIRMATVRLNTDGSLDAGFGGTGLVYTNGAAHAFLFGQALAIQSDGKIVIVGRDTDNTAVSNVALVRFNLDGTLDATLNGTGRVATDIPGIACEQANDVSVQADGKIVVLGDDGGCGLADVMFMVRYNSNGSLDSSFGTSGVRIFGSDGLYSLSNSLAVQSDGKFVIGGQYLFNAAAQAGFYRFQ